MGTRPALINVMAKAAEKAGKKLARDFGEVEHLQISRKGPADFVSTADLNAQKSLRADLAKARPNFGFLTEEEDGQDDKPDAIERWIIDPLDGTTNFLHGIPHFAISIAVEKAGEVISGMVYNPVTHEMFWAEKNQGAFCSDTRIRVSSRKELTKSLVATGLPFKGSGRDHDQVMKEVGMVVPKVAGFRRAGAASLDLAYVASGRLEAFWEHGLGAWDVAAGMIIVKEAGGFIAPMERGKNPVHTGALIATNAELHDGFVQLIRSAA